MFTIAFYYDPLKNDSYLNELTRLSLVHCCFRPFSSSTCEKFSTDCVYKELLLSTGFIYPDMLQLKGSACDQTQLTDCPFLTRSPVEILSKLARQFMLLPSRLKI